MGNRPSREERSIEQEKKQEQEQKRREKECKNFVSNTRMSLQKRRPGDTLSRHERIGLKFPKHLYISLFGELGIGKTSLINSMKYALFGGLSSRHEQPVADGCQSTHTRRLVPVSLTNNLSVIDSRALQAEAMNDQKVQDKVLDNIVSYLDGNFTLEAFDWDSPQEELRRQPGPESYCTVLVFSAKHPNVVRSYGKLTDRLYQRQGRFPLAVITYVDQAPAKDVRRALKHIGISQIFEVANVRTEEPDLQEQSLRSVLELLDKCTEMGDEVFCYRCDLEGGERRGGNMPAP